MTKKLVGTQKEQSVLPQTPDPHLSGVGPRQDKLKKPRLHEGLVTTDEKKARPFSFWVPGSHLTRRSPPKHSDGMESEKKKRGRKSSLGLGLLSPPPGAPPPRPGPSGASSSLLDAFPELPLGPLCRSAVPTTGQGKTGPTSPAQLVPLRKLANTTSVVIHHSAVS